MIVTPVFLTLTRSPSCSAARPHTSMTMWARWPRRSVTAITRSASTAATSAEWWQSALESERRREEAPDNHVTAGKGFEAADAGNDTAVLELPVLCPPGPVAACASTASRALAAAKSMWHGERNGSCGGPTLTRT